MAGEILLPEAPVKGEDGPALPPPALLDWLRACWEAMRRTKAPPMPPSSAAMLRSGPIEGSNSVASWRLNRSAAASL